MNNITFKFWLFILLLGSFSAHANLKEFKELMQREIVNGMYIANDDDNPINYGEQGSLGSKQGKLNPRYWVKLGNYHFKLKAGVSASEAVESIFPQSENSYAVELECHSMLIAIIYRAMLQGLGKERFDELFGMKGSSNQKIEILYGDLKTSGLEEYFLKKNISKNKVELGDWVYFQNHPDYLAKHPDGAWQGENAIYVGESGGNKYYSGFGAEELTEAQMNAELLHIYNENQTENDQEILKREWDKMLGWLKENSEFQKEKYFQLKASLFEDIAFDEDPEDFVHELFEPIAKSLGFESVSFFATEFDYGAEEYEDGQYIFWVEKIKSYQDKVSLKDIPGIVRIDRLDFEKIYRLR